MRLQTVANFRLLEGVLRLGAWAIIENLYATFWGDVYWTNVALPVRMDWDGQRAQSDDLSHDLRYSNLGISLIASV